MILPVWHNITTDEVRKYSPILADRVAVLSDRGLEHVVEELLRVIEPASEPVHPAVTGVPLSPGEDTENNLQVRLIRKPNTQHTVFAVFEARYWAEDIGFELKTNSPIRSQGWGFPAFSGMRQISILEKKEDYLYAVQITNERIVPRSPFVMWVTFDEGVDPRKAITKVNRWDGTGGEPSLRFIDFTSQR